MNAVSSIFSLQLGPALASATMSTLLWLPLWIGIALLLFAVPLISTLPPTSTPTSTTTHPPPPTTTEEEQSLLSTPSTTPPRNNLRSTTRRRLHTVLVLLTDPSRNRALLLAVFFLASLASSDTKLLPLYISKRYGWRFAQVGYLLSLKAVFNFFLLSVLIPRFLRWRARSLSHGQGDSEGGSIVPGGGVGGGGEVHAQNISHAHLCLVFSVLGAAAIGLAPTVAALVPALLVYALGIALPMFTYSLLKAPGMGLEGRLGVLRGEEAGQGMQLFSVVMLVRTVGTLVGAVTMPALYVMGIRVGGWALGLPFGVSAVCYALAGVVVTRIEV